MKQLRMDRSVLALAAALLCCIAAALCAGSVFQQIAAPSEAGSILSSALCLVTLASAALGTFICGRTVIIERDAAAEDGRNKVPYDAADPKTEDLSLALRAQDQKLDNLHLSRKETAVARLILANQSYETIAEKLGVCKRTVQYHASHIYAKAHVESRNAFEVLMTRR